MLSLQVFAVAKWERLDFPKIERMFYIPFKCVTQCLGQGIFQIKSYFLNNFKVSFDKQQSMASVQNTTGNSKSAYFKFM